MTLIEKSIKAVYTWAGSITDMRGPCPEGFHVPTKDERQGLYDLGVTIGAWTSSDGNNIKNYLKMAFSGVRNRGTSSVANQGVIGRYWTATAKTDGFSYSISFDSSNITPQDSDARALGVPIRAFKDTFVSPTVSWTTLYAGTGNAGIFHNSSDGIISITSDGSTGYTIADKNIGATSVYSDGDALNQSNCGTYFQWGNNYGFPFTGSVSSTTTRVNASSYGPGNYYSSSTFIKITSSPVTWDSSDNTNLRGGVTGPLTEHKIRPSAAPITEVGIYWSSDLGVISFQTSAGSGISIADKNLGATQVYNSGDTLSFANYGYGYQWGNNYGWKYNVNPTTTSTSQVNASTYGPGNYYSSSTYRITGDNNRDSSNNLNLWGSTTDTDVARRGPCPEGWHVPSKANAQTLVNAISSITGSVNGTKIKQYCKLPSTLIGIRRYDGQWTDELWCGIVYSDNWDSNRNGLLYLPTNGSYVVNEYTYKAEALPIRPFSNSFIQPTDTWTKLN